jgi:hypothetical protein
MPRRTPSILVVGWVPVWPAGLSGLGEKAIMAPPEQDLTLRIKVLFLPAAIDVAKQGIRVDAEPLVRQAVLSDKAGTSTPLVWHDASLALSPDAVA